MTPVLYGTGVDKEINTMQRRFNTHRLAQWEANIQNRWYGDLRSTVIFVGNPLAGYWTVVRSGGSK